MIEFGLDRSEADAALYELPFEYALRSVKPIRDENKVAAARNRWWLFARPRPELRRALAPLKRCIVTPEVAKHRLFVWMDTDTVPDHTLHVIAREDDYFFGLVQARPHELWSLAQGNYMGMGNDPRYTSTRTFETYPFPWPPGQEPAGDVRLAAVGQAARELVRLRDEWLNPPNTDEAELKKRTLTNLYNARPTWLANAHRALDVAVFAAYGWPDTLTDEEILERLLALNAARSR